MASLLQRGRRGSPHFRWRRSSTPCCEELCHGPLRSERSRRRQYQRRTQETQADTSATYLPQSVVTLPPGARWWHVVEALVITGNGDLACSVTRKYQAEVMIAQKFQLRAV